MSGRQIFLDVESSFGRIFPELIVVGLFPELNEAGVEVCNVVVLFLRLQTSAQETDKVVPELGSDPLVPALPADTV